MPRFLVIKGADEGKQFELQGPEVSIGRDATNRIRLHDTEVSRRHAECRQVEDGYAIVDVGSANGTYVNNQRVKEIMLHAGDQVVVGQTTLVYSTGRGEKVVEDTDLADKISLITRSDLEFSSAIIKTISEAEGSRLLAHPEHSSPWLKSALANLTIMYEASQAISHILDLNELLDRILELIFRSIEADRGCVMLRNAETGELEPKALRWRSQPQSQEKIDISRTITDYALQEKKGVLCSDAARDDRFAAGESIIRLGIHEVICVPMKGRHETLGVLYLDTYSTARQVVTRDLTTGKFTEDHLALASAIAHQAALALEETRYHQAMLQAERLAAIGQTIAALSHHIKNIMQGLRSGSDLLRMGLAEKNENLLQQGWKIAEKSQARIYDLVMDMLSFSKDREPAAEPTNINEVVRDVIELVAARAKEAGIKVEIESADKVPIVSADPEGMHRAILNIIGNALDAVEAKPQATVRVTTNIEPGGGWLRIAVEDNGAGVPAEKISEIFKPFVSTKGAKGTGLGLAVSRKILREHGGDITVDTQPGRGSTFTLRLPIKSPLSPDPSTGEMPIWEPPTKEVESPGE